MTPAIKLNLGLYFAAIVVLLILAVLAGDRSVDIHLPDSYIVVPAGYVFKAPALLLVIVSIGYFAARRFTRIASLTAIHTLGTLGLVAWILGGLYRPANGLSTAGYADFESVMHRFRLLRALVQLLLWWQLLLPLNWVLSGVRHEAGKRTDIAPGDGS